jgi:anti-sigma-K factor RskA
MTEETPTTSPTPKPCHATRWLAATVACLLVLAIGAATFASMFAQFTAQITHLQTKLKSVAQIKYISVLLDDKGAPAMLVTLDPQESFVQIQRLNSVKEGPEDSMQLWVIPATGKPKSIGVVATKIQTAQLAANEKTLAGMTQLAISVENKGDVEPDRNPSLPYLFKGALIQKAL